MTHAGPAPQIDIELWGGLECTVNRVGNAYFDQLRLSGHADRISDLDLIAELGIRTLRYPLVWERIAPGELDKGDWRWADERMSRLEALGITPIVGLVHHGSGPHHTSLLDPAFPEKLALYARMVAERYPHIRYVTPINEPLTTARFSALYGHWYPHTRSVPAFARALLNQIVAIRKSVQAMREVIPGIKLVQTEDLGKTYSTPRLEYQAQFENERRWLTFDLLCGRVIPGHPMWSYLADNAGSDSALLSLAADPCPPDIAGINYYVTSERFLDEFVERHAPERIGGNGIDAYADVEAVRARPAAIAGHAGMLCETWARYGIPTAITEAHLGCTREQQLRWLREAWEGAATARERGCDVRAVTAWALLGSFGWDSLVTREPFSYESGAFDISRGLPRPTALAGAIREITSFGRCTHPASLSPGWWRQPGRLNPEIVGEAPIPQFVDGRSRPLLITGARGTLGRAIARICKARGLEARAVSRAELDIANAGSVEEMIGRVKPWAVINAAGYVRVDDAEREPGACYRTNAAGVSVLAENCADAEIPLVTFSSDLVFNGTKRSPYVESDPVAPLNEYGRSKADAESRALALSPDSLVIRTSAFFGPWDQHNFISAVLRTLADGLPFVAADDLVVSPTYVPDLANATLDLLIDGERGIWHVANEGAVTWYDLAVDAASRAGLSPGLIRPAAYSSIGRPSRQPSYSVLGTERCQLLPTLQNALDRYFSEAALPALRPAMTW